MSANDLGALQAKFGDVNWLTIDAGEGGLTRCTIRADGATCEVYQQGAHVTRYARVGEQPLLFVSSKSLYAPGKAIRGGVPIIFPWFGAHATDPAKPAHGLARAVPWELTEAAVDGERKRLLFTLRDSAQTRELWPHPFEVTYSVSVGSDLHLALNVHNPGDKPFDYEEALHTYFEIGDIRECEIEGLDGAEYIDKTRNFERRKQEGTLRISEFTDSVFLDTISALTLRDRALGRTITLEKSGSSTTVVWNPWKALSDLGEEDWPKMVCIEAANADRNRVTLAPGERHSMSTTIR